MVSIRFEVGFIITVFTVFRFFAVVCCVVRIVRFMWFCIVVRFCVEKSRSVRVRVICLFSWKDVG